MSMCISSAQAGATRGFLGRGIFPVIGLVACPCAFRLHRFAQNGPVLGARPFPAKSRIKLLLLHVHVHFDCAGSHEVCTLKLCVCGIFAVNSRMNGLLPAKFLSRRSLHDQYRSLTEGLVEILLRSSLRCPCMKILQMPCLTGGSAPAADSFMMIL